jgi:hypothetical protein
MHNFLHAQEGTAKQHFRFFQADAFPELREGFACLGLE